MRKKSPNINIYNSSRGGARGGMPCFELRPALFPSDGGDTWPALDKGLASRTYWYCPGGEIRVSVRRSDMAGREWLIKNRSGQIIATVFYKKLLYLRRLRRS